MVGSCPGQWSLAMASWGGGDKPLSPWQKVCSFKEELITSKPQSHVPSQVALNIQEGYGWYRDDRANSARTLSISLKPNGIKFFPDNLSQIWSQQPSRSSQFLVYMPGWPSHPWWRQPCYRLTFSSNNWKPWRSGNVPLKPYIYGVFPKSSPTHLLAYLLHDLSLHPWDFPPDPSHPGLCTNPYESVSNIIYI